nr:retrovirus-related Pol polyprotein from transposon TNT 1-94 [Tanacetum cinerariifolium]
MTRNKCYLIDYEDYDGRFVSFRDGKGRISRKGKIKTRTLDFDDVYFYTECLVLSSNFKLLDESQVLLRVPRKDNIYSVDLKSVVPIGGLTCLVAKATTDESNLWHMKLGHINYKTMNKLTNITRIENQLDCKVKVISCDNGDEFKNSVMNKFCDMKGIKREFSVARTPQQNGVAKKKNKTLIEAVRTMALVIKPHNKTPYELIHGRPPQIDFMKPFGWYSVVSKAIRVFNKRTMIVEETLNIRFLKNAPNVKGNGPDWLFDIDSLTISMNYVLVVAGFQTNGIAGTKDNIVAGQAKKKKEPKQEYILIPICTTDPLISQGPKDSVVDDGKNATDVDESQVSDTGPKDSAVDDGKNATDVDESQVSDTGGQDDQVTIKTLVQTRQMTKMNEEHGLISSVQKLRNKKDGRGIMIKKKARLVGQRHTQEEGIDFDEVFALVARIESIRLFLANASFKDFVVYQMDVKSDFLYGKIEKEVYVCQPPGFKDLDFPDKVYKVKKALYGLHQAPRAWYEILSTYLMDNGFYSGQIDKTLFIKRHKDDILLVQVYVDDIIFGSTKKK